MGFMKSTMKPIGGAVFTAALGRALQVSKVELQRRIEADKVEKAGRPRRGPKPKSSASGRVSCAQD